MKLKCYKNSLRAKEAFKKCILFSFANFNNLICDFNTKFVSLKTCVKLCIFEFVSFLFIDLATLKPHNIFQK